MRVLIVSDTHRHGNNFYDILEKQSSLDMVIHCGDVEGQELEFREVVFNLFQCAFLVVAGNNDFFSDLRHEVDVMIGGYRTWVTHGHNFYVSMGNEFIKQEAQARGFDIVMYGHTHRPLIEHSGGITIINPGSLSYPRQEGRRPSYVIMEIDDKGQANYEICYI